MLEPTYTRQSTHGGWIGVDLDGTAAYHELGSGCETIGPPIHEMVARVNCWLRAGVAVKFVSARFSSKNDQLFVAQQHDLLAAWCDEHLERRVPGTAEKDFRMLAIWDDRAITVEHNTGRILTTEQG